MAGPPGLVSVFRHGMAGGKVIQSIKAAAEMMGRASARMRIESMELNGEEKKAVRGVLEELELV